MTDLATAHRMLTAIAVELGVDRGADLAAAAATLRNERREAREEVARLTTALDEPWAEVDRLLEQAIEDRDEQRAEVARLRHVIGETRDACRGLTAILALAVAVNLTAAELQEKLGEAFAKMAKELDAALDAGGAG